MWAGYRSVRVPARRPRAPRDSKQSRGRTAIASSRRGMLMPVALLVLAAAACASARPPGTGSIPVPRKMTPDGLPDYLSEYLVPRLFLPPEYFTRHLPPASSDNTWLNQEIYRINNMDEDDDRVVPYDVDPQWIRIPIEDLRAPDNFDVPIEYAPEEESYNPPEDSAAYYDKISRIKLKNGVTFPPYVPKSEIKWRKFQFAFTPEDKGYYARESKSVEDPEEPHPQEVRQEAVALKAAMAPEPPRQTRQNPNLSKQKNLLGPDLGKLKTGLSEATDEATDQPRHIHLMEATTDPAESIYGVAIFAAVGAALTMAIVGFAFGWYTLSKKAKAAADVDYPAYGVTGPTIDSSGDRKLAQSAHMYHYQHQKQQIIAMERNGMEQRAGSVSDPESEEENEEGDYTVYECPGFATTGDMEVKNPMFSEDPTPATPGRCELVKPQPKD